MGFAADRLTLIRARRGWTRARLAERSGVAERAIRQYEAGEAQPRDGSLAKLAAALEVPAEFFYGPPIEDLGESAATFRAATKLPAYRRRAALAAGSFAMHFADWIAEHFDLPAVDIPDLDGVEPELAAEAVRSAWGLGNDPAPNMVHLLEAKGVFVFGLAEDCRELDAFSFWRHGRPFVLLNTMKSAEHARFDSGHELAHLVLHRHVRRTTKEQEDEAQRFSAAFLLPPRAMLATGLSHPRLADIVALKAAWQVAATTLVRRLHDVGLLSPYHYRTLMIELSKRGYRSSEPDGLPRETSRLLATVIRAMRSEGVAVHDIARQLTIEEHDLTEMMLGLATVAVTNSR